MKYIGASSYYQCRLCLDHSVSDTALFVQNSLIHRSKTKQRIKGLLMVWPWSLFAQCSESLLFIYVGNTDLVFTHLRLISYGNVPEAPSCIISGKDVIFRKKKCSLPIIYQYLHMEDTLFLTLTSNLKWFTFPLHRQQLLHFLKWKLWTTRRLRTILFITRCVCSYVRQMHHCLRWGEEGVSIAPGT